MNLILKNNLLFNLSINFNYFTNKMKYNIRNKFFVTEILNISRGNYKLKTYNKNNNYLYILLF
jgi:hypothetical protein